MPPDPFRVTRSSRVSKQPSKTQLNDRPQDPASRSRRRDQSSNKPPSRGPRPPRKNSHLSPTPTSLISSSRIAAIQSLIAQEEDRLRDLDPQGEDEVGDIHARLESPIAQQLEKEKQLSYTSHGHPSRRHSRHHCSTSPLPPPHPALGIESHLSIWIMTSVKPLPRLHSYVFLPLRRSILKRLCGGPLTPASSSNSPTPSRPQCLKIQLRSLALPNCSAQMRSTTRSFAFLHRQQLQASFSKPSPIFEFDY